MNETSGTRRFVIRSALAYSGTNLVAQAALFASAFVLRRILAPQAMGVWNLVSVIRGYVQPIGLGVAYGAYRELPILRGQGNAAAEVRCRSVALSYSVAEAAVLAVGVSIYALWRAHGGIEFYALLVTGVLIVLARVTELHQVFFQGAQRYVSVSKVLLATSLAFAILLPLGALRGGVAGLLGAAIVAEGFRAGWLVFQGRRAGLRSSLSFDTGELKRLASFGFGYRVTDYPMTVFQSLDLLWVTKLMGLQGLALYAFAKGVYSQASDVTSRMGTVMYTRMLAQYGEGAGHAKIARDMRRFLLFQLLVSIPLVCWAVASIGSFAIRHITPLYAGSVPVLVVLLPASFFIAQNNNLFTIWIAERRLISYGVSNIVGVAAVGGMLAFVWFTLGRATLSGVAAATVAGYTVYFAYMMLSAGRELWGVRAASTLLLQGIAAAAWTTAVLLLVIGGAPAAAHWRAELSAAALRALEGLVALLPPVIYGLWVTGSLSHAARWARRRIQPDAPHAPVADHD